MFLQIKIENYTNGLDWDIDTADERAPDHEDVWVQR